MCLFVRQRFEPNDISIICYKAVYRRYEQELITLYRGAVIEDGFLSAMI